MLIEEKLENYKDTDEGSSILTISFLLILLSVFVIGFINFYIQRERSNKTFSEIVKDKTMVIQINKAISDHVDCQTVVLSKQP